MEDPRWLGGDGAYSVDLGDARVLWLFGDSFVDPDGSGRRDESRMIRNTVGIQNGYDPTSASMAFYWGPLDAAGDPTPLFPGRDPDTWRWPLHGIVVDDVLLLFFMDIAEAPGDGGFGFEAVGWSVARVANPGAAPTEWTVTWPAIPEVTFAPVIAGSAVLRDGGFVYAYVVREPGNHDVFLMRWTEANAAAGTLTDPEWSDGAAWVANAALSGAPAVIIPEAATEMSVHLDPETGRFVQAQTVGFGAADLALRSAPRPEGPWTPPAEIHHPAEGDDGRWFVYAGKAHPELDAGGALALTYAANAWDFWDLFRPKGAGIYWPRFVRWEGTPDD